MNGFETDALISKALAGDESARKNLLLRNEDRLRRVITIYLDSRLAARIDPSDILQDSMVKALKKLPEFLQDRSMAFYPWIRQIVRDQLIDTYRKHVLAERRSVRLEQLQPRITDASAAQLVDRLVGTGTSPTAAFSREERRMQVKNALKQLSEDEQELLLMRFFEQLRVTEIAEVLSVPLETAKSRIRRALEKMNRILHSS